MSDEEHRAILMGSIDAVLGRRISVPGFRSRYYDYYVDVLPESALTDADRDLFAAVQEKLDWVDEAPDAESRRAGWIDYDEFIAWLRVLRPRFG
mgnify:CR=1 FL=1